MILQAIVGLCVGGLLVYAGYVVGWRRGSRDAMKFADMARANNRGWAEAVEVARESLAREWRAHQVLDYVFRELRNVGLLPPSNDPPEVEH